MIDQNNQASQQQLSPEQLEGLKRLSERSLYFFAKFILGYDWLDKRIHKPLCDILQDYETNNRVAVTLPRSWLKSTVCSISFPIWRVAKNPELRVLIVQNTENNAKAKLRAIKGHFEGSELFRMLWHEVLPDKTCRWTALELEVKRVSKHAEATFEAAGRNTQKVSRHYNLIIEDDTVAPDKDEYTEDNVLPTKEDIGQAIGYHRACSMLLVDINCDQILIVGTRWFELDLLSWNKQKEPWYTRYELAITMTDGKPDQNGEYIWPQRYGPETAKKLEASLGIYLYSCLYLNTPLRSEDAVFNKLWFSFYADEPANLEVKITVDPAGNPKNSTAKRKRNNDENVIMVVGKHPKTGKIYVLNYISFRGSPGDLCDRLFELVVMYEKRLVEVGVEAIAYQEALDWILTEEMRKRNIFFSVKLIKHGGRSKEHRIRCLAPLIKTQTMVFRPWMVKLISQLEMFPYATYDDLADALSMHLQLFSIISLSEQPTLEQEDETSFSLDSAIRSLARPYQPPKASYMDVLTIREGNHNGSPDPYRHLFERENETLTTKASRTFGDN